MYKCSLNQKCFKLNMQHTSYIITNKQIKIFVSCSVNNNPVSILERNLLHPTKKKKKKKPKKQNKTKTKTKTKIKNATALHRIQSHLYVSLWTRTFQIDFFFQSWNNYLITLQPFWNLCWLNLVAGHYCCSSCVSYLCTL